MFTLSLAKNRSLAEVFPSTLELWKEVWLASSARVRLHWVLGDNWDWQPGQCGRHWLLGLLSSNFLIFIHIIIFMWKGTCNSLGSAICLQALVCHIWIQGRFSTVSVHGWHAYACVYVYVCSGVCMACLCVCPWCWHKRPSILGLLATSYLQPTSLMCQEL